LLEDLKRKQTLSSAKDALKLLASLDFVTADAISLDTCFVVIFVPVFGLPLPSNDVFTGTAS